MNVLLVIPFLLVGGAEVFVVRLANSLAQRGHRVFLLHFDANHGSGLLTERISDRVTLVPLNYKLSSAQKIWWKLLYLATQWNAAWYRKVVFRRKKLRANALAGFLEEFCEQENIEVINSHLQAADWSVAHYFWKKKIRRQKFVISMHGCYNRTEYPANSALKGLNTDTRKLMETADRIVLLTPKNATPLQGYTLKNDPVYIPLGFEKPDDERDMLDTLTPFPLIFGLVSRAAARKGWEEAIEATTQLHKSGVDCRLVLVGDGERLFPLQSAYGHLPYIHFVGATAHVLDWVPQFDVGLFPSYIESESYPNTVIEYLACGKPVIGTNIGEVKNMMSTADGRLAGKLLRYLPEGISVEELTDCMRHYVENPNLLTEHGSLANEAFQKFDMEHCLNAYEKVYR